MELFVDINVIPKGEGKINNILLPSGNPLGCDNANSLEVLSIPYIGAIPYLIGISPLDYGDVYSYNGDTYDGFMSEILANGIGEFNENNEIKIDGTNLDHLVIVFDQRAAQWATKLCVNGIEYRNIGSQFVWRSDKKCDVVTIKILEWNTPGYPFRVTGIFTGLTLRVDKHCIKECVRGSQCTADNKLPKFCVQAGYDDLTIYDVDGELRELAEMGIINKGHSVSMFISYDNVTEQIGSYTVSKWDYNMIKKEIKIELKETIEQLEQIEFLELNIYNTIMKLSSFMNDLAEVYKSLGFILNPTLPNRLEMESYSYVKLPTSNYKVILDEICKLHGLYAMQNGMGEIIFVDI